MRFSIGAPGGTRTLILERRLILSFPALPTEFDGLRICLLSDLHLKRPDALFGALVEYLGRTAFDLGCCAGDVECSPGMDMRIPRELARKLFAASSQRFGWYVVRGNNDSPRFIRQLDTGAVHVLHNRSVRLGDSAPPLFVVGVDDPDHRHDDLDAALEGVPRDAFTILLAHSPDIIHRAERKKVSLVLCGHTHGGQVRLPWAGPVLTQTRVGRKYCWGLARKLDTLIFTTCGVGCTFVPLRVNCPSEVVSITLRRSSAPHVDSSARAVSPCRGQSPVV